MAKLLLNLIITLVGKKNPICLGVLEGLNPEYIITLLGHYGRVEQLSFVS